MIYLLAGMIISTGVFFLIQPPTVDRRPWSVFVYGMSLLGVIVCFLGTILVVIMHAIGES